ncbi:uncharacterized protein ALTATR162_LOCUS3670 [Alternaria atra]|uniref:NAD(P)-binding protein n=1 Tax=Alternaria atra TaxID=119953 RepID=A0A8J2I2I9_9PLEO|nr:uncharacterized protein ALTATR162_LOCUS3670 [Alternaria atra]CAG5155456.1 unnamed protein product [Alternaria atra]
MPTAVITGANSGIGNALAKILIREGYEVIAADKTLGSTIQSLGCQAYQLDISSGDSITSFVNSISQQTSIDLLLHVAGVMSPPSEDTLTTVSLSALQNTFSVNTFGPILLTQALLPNILKSLSPKIAVVSSRVGSMADNTSGGQYAYRASKAAVNSLFKSASVDLKDKGVAVLVLHPGIVKTALDARHKEEEVPGAVEPEEAAEGLWDVLSRKGLESTGMFFHRNGEELPW